MSMRGYRRRAQLAVIAASLSLACTVVDTVSHWWFFAIETSRVHLFVGDHTVDCSYWPWQGSRGYAGIRCGPVGTRHHEWRFPWRPVRTENVISGHGVSAPLWNIAVLSGALSVVLFRAGCRGSRGTCSKCGYDLTGNVSGRCPECGELIATTTASVCDKGGSPTRRDESY